MNTTHSITDGHKKNVIIFGMWARLFVVSVFAIYAYQVLGLVAAELSSDIHWLENASETLRVSLLGKVLFWVAGALLWWRAVKLFVFLGVPFPLGIQTSWGREDYGIKGRVVQLVHIGDYDVYRKPYEGKFWYGAVFRSHPKSDKLVRTRLEHLVLKFPFCSVTLIVGEGRFMIRRKTHEERATIHRQKGDRYNKTRESMPSEKFRKQVVNNLKEMHRSLRTVQEYFVERRLIEAIAAEEDKKENGDLSNEEKEAIYSIGRKLSSSGQKSTDYITEAGREILLRLRRRGLIKRVNGPVTFAGEGEGYGDVEITDEGREMFEEVRKDYEVN